MPPTDDELTSSAVLEELQSSRNLIDAVIPDVPAPPPNRTSFALGSCQYPGGFIDEAAAYKSYRDLAHRLTGDDEGRPRFVVLTGDQVYTDATAGLFDPSIADGRYRLPYLRWLRARAVRTALSKAHSFMLLDDHEIEDNWEETAGGVTFDTAIRSYMKFQRHKDALPDRRYFSFRFDGFEFFMLDTRTRRDKRTLTNVGTADLIDGQPGLYSQGADLANWIQTYPHDRPKFIVSPSMLLPRHREAARWDAAPSALHSDGWDGYLRSLHETLVLAQKTSTHPVVFLSGDEHIGCIATITVRNHDDATEKTFYSIHTPGLFTPYTFANSGVADWMPEAGREFTVGGSTFDYTVSYSAFPGAGFAYISVEKQNSHWHLTCQFADGPVHSVF